MKITDRDNGYRKRMKALLSLQSGRVVVGVFDTARATIAAIHEFGAPSAGIPQRSFLRATVDEKSAVIREALRRFAKDVAGGKSTRLQAETAFGKFIVALVKQRITAGILPRNTAETLRRKRGSTPLIDTGKLLASIKAKVSR